jgi:FkbM family methyltransferase
MKFVPGARQLLLAALTRRYPLYSGGIRFANHPLIRRLGGTSDELVWSRVKGGEVLTGLNDLVGRTAFYTGDLDRKISWVCARIVRPGDTVLDIGANLGIVTLWLSKLVGKRGRVYAFEPNPELYEVLEKTIHRNQAMNVRPYAIALGARADQMELRIRGGNSGSGSLVMNDGLAGCKVYSVPVRSLDEIAIEQKMEAIRLIKIDVEGFEAEVFRGGSEVLNRIRPQAVLFEFIQNGEGRLSGQPVFQMLQESGYGFFAIPKCRFRMYLERCDPEGVNDPTTTDFLAVQKNESFEQIARAVKART